MDIRRFMKRRKQGNDPEEDPMSTGNLDDRTGKLNQKQYLTIIQYIYSL